MQQAMFSGPDSNWGRALAYHPNLSHFFGSVNAGILFGQLAYWQERTQNPLGVFKTADEWEEETGLTYREQVTARKILAADGYVIETNKRVEHKLFYRIEWDTFNPAYRAWLERRGGAFAPTTKAQFPNDVSAVREQRKAQFGNCGKRSSYIEESTAEITSEKRPAGSTSLTPKRGKKDEEVKPLSLQDLIAEGIPQAVAAEWLSIRKDKRLKLTPLAWDGIKAEASKAGLTLEATLLKCIQRGWGSFDASWVARDSRPAAMTPASRDEINKASTAGAKRLLGMFGGEDDGRTIDA